MPQVIYLPKPINPLTDQLPQFLQQLVLLKMGHKMDMEKAQTAAKLASAQKTSETQEKAENKGFRPGPWDTSQPGVVTIGGTPYKAPPPPAPGDVFNPTKGDVGEYEDRSAKTLDQAYLRQNPNATPEQIAQYKQSTAPTKTSAMSGLSKLISERDALPEGHPNRAIYDAAISKTVTSKGMVIESDGKGGFSIRTNAEQGIPGMSLSPGAKTEVQKDVIGLEDRIQELKSVGKDALSEIFTYRGRVKQGALRIADMAEIPLSKDNKEYLGKTRRFIEGLEQSFNAYRKEITGAQAAMKEISMLRDSILNKKLSPTEYEYSYNRYLSQMERSLRLKRMLLRNGIQPQDLGKKIDDLYTSGSDVDENEIDARGDELKSTGLSDEAVIQKLRSEGYPID